MFQSKMQLLLEDDNITGFLTLQRADIDDNTLMKMFQMKPGELNILFARTASFLKNDTNKTKRELTNDILEVLERSTIARKFVGMGLNQEYKLFKGFPVRHGDPYESMPAPGQELVLKPTEAYIGWLTDPAKARENAAKYDVSKGEPIGGLLIQTFVDSGKLLFDVNAVVKAVKLKINVINKYNTLAPPGKALSKGNTKYLAEDAPLYHGDWEIITSQRIVNTTVVDKWTWDSSSGKKTIKWATSDVPEPQKPVPGTPGTPAPAQSPQPQTPAPTPNPIAVSPERKKVQEDIMRLFENTIYDELEEEMSSAMGTAKSLYDKILSLDTIVKQYTQKKLEFLKTRVDLYKLKIERALLIKDDKTAKLMEKYKTEAEELTNQTQEQLDKITNKTSEQPKAAPAEEAPKPEESPQANAVLQNILPHYRKRFGDILSKLPDNQKENVMKALADPKTAKSSEELDKLISLVSGPVQQNKEDTSTLSKRGQVARSLFGELQHA